MKIGVCAIVKNENLYLREWTEHYIALGFDKIILYDNNDPCGEIPEHVIFDYVLSGKVDVIRWNKPANNMGAHNNNQMEAYNNCIQRYKSFDWIAFFDCDEFLHLEHHTNIHDLFNEYGDMYNQFNEILVSWMIMGDPNALFYENRPMKERFQIHLQGAYTDPEINGDDCFKSIIKPASDVRFVFHSHSTNTNIACCATGLKCYIYYNGPTTFIKPIHKVMWLDHYYTKSLTEYLTKSIRSHHRYYHNESSLDTCINQYKCFNGWSDKHEEVFRHLLKANIKNPSLT